MTTTTPTTEDTMGTYINQSIQAGRELAAIEQQLATAIGAERADLNRRWSATSARRQDLIQEAIATVGIQTVRFALDVHEQL